MILVTYHYVCDVCGEVAVTSHDTQFGRSEKPVMPLGWRYWQTGTVVTLLCPDHAHPDVTPEGVTDAD